jgi:hypothetical protein
MENLTPEQIAKQYSAAMDSVTLINGYVAGEYGGEVIEKNEENIATVERNVGHLTIMVEKDYWTDEDLQPFHDAITAGQEYISEE